MARDNEVRDDVVSMDDVCGPRIQPVDTEGMDATQTRVQSSEHQREHSGPGAVDVGSGSEAVAQTKRRHRAGRGAQGEGQSVVGHGSEAALEIAPVVRLVPKRPGPDTQPVVEFVEEFLEQLKSGKIQADDGLVIHYLTSCGPLISDGCKHHFWRHGLSTLQHVGLLALATSDVLQDGHS